jgi:hypothetical protein
MASTSVLESLRHLGPVFRSGEAVAAGVGPRDLMHPELGHTHEQVEHGHREQHRRVREHAALGAAQ